MNVSKIQLFALATVVAFAGVMQGAEQGTFHLMTRTHWGRAVLEPGDYKLRISDLSLEQKEVRIEGSDKAVFEMPLLTTQGKSSSSSYLKLSEIDGNYYVREFSSGATGKIYMFQVPRAKHRQAPGNGTDSSFSLSLK